MRPAALAALVLLGGILFAANADGARDLAPYAYLLVPLAGGALVFRSLNAGAATALLALPVGYVLAIIRVVI